MKRKFLVIKSEGLGFETASFRSKSAAVDSVRDWFGDYIIVETLGLVQVVSEQHMVEQQS
jgi:predicted xylose isomerase-like sugar epimerase